MANGGGEGALTSEEALESSDGQKFTGKTVDFSDSTAHVKWYAEKYINLLYLYCRAFETDEDDWMQREACFEKLKKAFEGDTPDDVLALSASKFGQPEDSHVLCRLHACTRRLEPPSKKEDLNRAFCLRKLRDAWQDGPTDLHRILREVGPKMAMKLLCGLCVRVPTDHIGHRHWFLNHLHPVKFAIGNYDQKRVLDRTATARPVRPGRWNHQHRSSYRSKVAIFYTETDAILNYCPCESGLRFLEFSQAVTLSGSKYDEHYATPVGQAITMHQWDVALPWFICKLGFDVSFQFFLSWYLAPICNSLKHADHAEWPRRGVLICLGLFGMRDLGWLLIDNAIALWCLCVGLYPSIFLSFWNPYTIFCTLVDIFTIQFLLRLVRDYWDHVDTGSHTGNQGTWEGTLLQEHPAQLCILIFVKWFQLMLSAMNTTLLLPKLLPAWVAIMSTDSQIFLLYLGVLFLGTTLAYYALPVPADSAEGDWFLERFRIFYRMFCLDFFGEFDDDEMEGVSQFVDKQTGYIESEDASDSEYHISVKAGTMIIGLLFPVILLNMYVGVLSQVYAKCTDHAEHLAGIYRSHSTCKLLIRRHFCNFMASSCCLFTFLSLDWCHVCFWWVDRLHRTREVPRTHLTKSTFRTSHDRRKLPMASKFGFRESDTIKITDGSTSEIRTIARFDGNVAELTQELQHEYTVGSTIRNMSIVCTSLSSAAAAGAKELLVVEVCEFYPGALILISSGGSSESRSIVEIDRERFKLVLDEPLEHGEYAAGSNVFLEKAPGKWILIPVERLEEYDQGSLIRKWQKTDHEQAMSVRFDKIEKNEQALSARFDKVDGRLDKIEEKLDRLVSCIEGRQ